MRESEGRFGGRGSEGRRSERPEGESGAFGYEWPEHGEYGSDYGSRQEQTGYGRQPNYGWGGDEYERRGWPEHGHGGQEMGRNYEGGEQWGGGRSRGWGLGGDRDEGFGTGQSRYGEQSRFGGYRSSRPSYFDQGTGYGSGMERGEYGGMDSPSTWGMGQGEWRGQQQRGGRFLRGGQRTQQGPYAGRGPQGYRRSDERVLEDIYEELTNHPNIDATNITAEVKGGEVILKGTVTDRNAKRMAEEIAEQCFGVKDVQNQIRVRRDESDAESRQQDEGKRGGKSAA